MVAWKNERRNQSRANVTPSPPLSLVCKNRALFCEEPWASTQPDEDCLCQRLGLMEYVWDGQRILRQVLLGVDLLEGYEEQTC